MAAGCGGSSVIAPGASSGGGERLNGAGSSLVYPIMTKWTSVYDKEKGVKVNYQSIGSGGGIQQMIAKTLDFGCSDAPMNDEQLAKAREQGGDVVHVPLVIGGVVPAYNVSGLGQPLRFTGPVLADIFLGKIKRWNDSALQALNPGVALPDKEILVVHRSDGSGTTYIFADYLAKVSPEWKGKVGVSTSLNWPCGVGQKGNEGVAGHVARADGSIGYIELIYARQNSIPFGAVQNREGEFVQASLESTAAAADAALTTIPDDLRFSLTDPPGKASYPISGAVWAVAYKQQAAEKRQLLVQFLSWVTHAGQQYAEALSYARLPKGLVERGEDKIEQIKIGP
jgi:phosphate transport system substrate-binding protein